MSFVYMLLIKKLLDVCLNTHQYSCIILNTHASYSNQLIDLHANSV